MGKQTLQCELRVIGSRRHSEAELRSGQAGHVNTVPEVVHRCVHDPGVHAQAAHHVGHCDERAPTFDCVWTKDEPLSARKRPLDRGIVRT